MWGTNSSKPVKEKPLPLDESVLMKRPVRRNQKQGDDCINVYCRVRPQDLNEQPNSSMAVMPEENTIEMLADSNGRPISKKYTFTQLFRDEPQEDVIDKLCRPMIDAVKQEAKGALIFAYGVTSSGKTHTVLGNQKEPGILEYFFRVLYKPFQLTAVEVYNDEFFPLVGSRNRIHLIESCGKLEFKDYEPITVETSNFNNILEQIKENRAQRSTNYNSKSSRSHAIFRIVSEGKVVGVVDLAGSERNREGCSHEETNNINKSLLTLGRCITCLRQARTTQIPFRDSRLTMALAEYFNPDFKLVMLININPSKGMVAETVNVLEYAAIAKDIKPSNTPVKSKLKSYLPSQSKSDDLSNIGEQNKSDLENKQVPMFNISLKKHESSMKEKSEASKREHYDEEEEVNKALREYILHNNVEMLKNQYMEKHRTMNEDFNIFFQKEIQEQKQRDDELFKRLKDQSSTEEEHGEVQMTSTCVNTMPLLEPNLESSFKKKTYKEYQLEYDQWLRTAEEKHRFELQQEMAKKEILERMYQDEVEELRTYKEISRSLEDKLQEEIMKRDKMETEVQEERRHDAELYDNKLQQERSKAEQQLKDEIAARKQVQQEAQSRIKKIQQEKDIKCKRLIEEKEGMAREMEQLRRQRDETMAELNAFKEESKRIRQQELERINQLVQTEAHQSSIKKKPTTKTADLSKSSSKLHQSGKIELRECQKSRITAAQRQREDSSKRKSNSSSKIEPPPNREKSKARKKPNKSLGRKASVSVEHGGEDASFHPRVRTRNQSKAVIEQPSSEQKDPRNPTPIKDRLRVRQRTKNAK